MNEHEKHVIWSGAAVATLLLLALGLSLGWPVWVWLPLCILITPAAILLTRELDRRTLPKPVYPEPESLELERPEPPKPEPMPAPPEVTEIVSHPVPSALADYRFHVSARVNYLPEPSLRSDQLGNLDVLARDVIQRRAAEFLRTRQPDEHDCLDDRLSVVLGVLQPAHGRVHAWATNVQVRLPEEDQKRLADLAQVRKSWEVWEHQREKERNVREYLSKDVFADPGRAVVWWLARELEGPNRKKEPVLGDLLEEVPALRRLTSATHEKEIPEWTDLVDERFTAEIPEDPVETTPTEPPLTRFLDEVLDGVAAEQRDMFIDRLAQLLQAHDQQHAADVLRQRWDDQDQLPFDEAEPETDEAVTAADDQPHPRNDERPATDDPGDAPANPPSA